MPNDDLPHSVLKVAGASVIFRPLSRARFFHLHTFRSEIAKGRQ